MDVSNNIFKKNIKRETELLALAQEQREQGKTDLVEFILNRSPKALEKIAQSKKSLIDLFQEA